MRKIPAPFLTFSVDLDERLSRAVQRNVQVRKISGQETETGADADTARLRRSSAISTRFAAGPTMKSA